MMNKTIIKIRPHNSESKKLKEDLLNSARALLKGRKIVFKAFESGIFLKNEELKKGTELKVYNNIIKSIKVSYKNGYNLYELRK